MSETLLLKLECDLCKKTEIVPHNFEIELPGWRRIIVQGMTMNTKNQKVLCADCLGKCGLA